MNNEQRLPGVSARRVIVRAWSARATGRGARAYFAHARRRVLPALRRVGGHRGSLVLRRRRGGDVEIVVLTFWDSLAAIRAFAGPDLTRAVVEPEARAVLRRCDTRARHFEVVLEGRARPGGR
jgi:heme-degrading monooxygenase HmoA